MFATAIHLGHGVGGQEPEYRPEGRPHSGDDIVEVLRVRQTVGPDDVSPEWLGPSRFVRDAPHIARDVACTSQQACLALSDRREKGREPVDDARLKRRQVRFRVDDSNLGLRRRSFSIAFMEWAS